MLQDSGPWLGGDFLGHIQVSRKIKTKLMILGKEMAHDEMISS